MTVMRAKPKEITFRSVPIGAIAILRLVDLINMRSSIMHMAANHHEF
jgi:hypothetical protein